MLITQKAKLVATVAHKACGQIRKYTGEDYIVHPIDVAEKLIEFGFRSDRNLISSAYLHDVDEDTGLDSKFIKDEFGEDISHLVFEVTNPSKQFPELSRKKRKAMDLESLKSVSKRVKVLKLSDVSCNAPSIIRCDPEFAKTWVYEAYDVINVCREGSEELYQDAKYHLDGYVNTLPIKGNL